MNEESYEFKTRIPFGWLLVTRSQNVQDGVTAFTHEIQFTGLLKKMLGNKIGKRYRAMLPTVMRKIKVLAESK